MSKSMLVNVSHEEESRVAVVEGGVLESLEIESISRSLKGNIYKAVVQNVNAALEAAFVDYGSERAGFLPLDEVNFKVLPTLPGRDGHRRGRITDHVAPGMEILVQVVRDAFSTKPPTFTTFYSLPGRYLVLTPKSDGQGISRKIEDAAQRDRLRKIVEELDPPEGFGLIVRTAGMGQSRTELQRDLRYLLRLWQSIDSVATTHRAPSLIYQERDIVLRTIRDHFTADIEEVLIDDEEVLNKASRFVQAIMPTKQKAFKLYRGDKPLFSKYNLEDQIESIFRREVGLKSGGAIVIDETEAMTTVDVNSARSAREANIEETALKTNLEAAEEIARQLRLRDLGGLTVIDFIDMYQDKHVRQVEKVMREALKKDRAKWDITRISKFGLMEISRQRLKATKASATYTSCSRCEGTGVVKTTEAAALSVFRRMQARVVKGDLGTLRATLPEEVAVYLLNQKREELGSLERRYGTRIVLVPHPTMNPNRGEFETVPRPPGEAPPAPARPTAADSPRDGEGRTEDAQQAPAEPREPAAGPTPETAPAPVQSGQTDTDDRGGEPAPEPAPRAPEMRGERLLAETTVGTRAAGETVTGTGEETVPFEPASAPDLGVPAEAPADASASSPAAEEQPARATESTGEVVPETPPPAQPARRRRRRRRRTPSTAPSAAGAEAPSAPVEPATGLLPWEQPGTAGVGPEADAAPPAVPAASGPSAPAEREGGRATDEAAAKSPSPSEAARRRRRRRRRRPRRNGSPAAADRAGAAGSGQSDAAGRTASGPPPGPPAARPPARQDPPPPQAPQPKAASSERQEDDQVPGGWWQRLTRGGRRGR